MLKIFSHCLFQAQAPRKRRFIDYALHSPSVCLHSPRTCCHYHELRGDGRGSCRFDGLPDFRPKTCLQRCGGSAPTAPQHRRQQQRLAPPSFSFETKRILHFGATATVKKKGVMGPPPSLAGCITSTLHHGPCIPATTFAPPALD